MVDGNGGGEGQSNEGTSLPDNNNNNDTFLKRFQIVGKIGEGSYSEVVKCKNRDSGSFVACKRLKRLYKSWNQVNDISEVTTLRTLTRHPHILQMLEIHYDVRLGKVSLVFEIMDMNLYEMIKDRKKVLPENTVRLYMFQLIKALRHLHKYGVFHRDIKPENILVRVKSNVLKLADLGSVRGIYSQPPFTEYISTRWYRSPECLLTAGQYGFKMDIWAAGCVFYEILTLQPLFPGSSEIDQINRIHTVMGTPPQRTLQKFSKHVENDKASCRTRNQQTRWDAMLKVIKEFSINPKYEEGKSKNYDWNSPVKDKDKIGLDRKLPSFISTAARDLVRQMLTYDPDARPSSQRIMNHPYFNDVRDFKIPESEVVKSPIIAVCGDELGRTMISYYYGQVDLKTLGDKKPQQRIKMQFSPVKQRQESVSASVSRTSSPILRGAMSPETPEILRNPEVKKPTNPILRSGQDSKHKLRITSSQHESPPTKTLKTDKSHAGESPSANGNKKYPQILKSDQAPSKHELPDYIKKSLIDDAYTARRDHLEAVRSKGNKIASKIVHASETSLTDVCNDSVQKINPRLHPKYVGATVYRNAEMPEYSSTVISEQVPMEETPPSGKVMKSQEIATDSPDSRNCHIKRVYDIAKKSLLAEVAARKDRLEGNLKSNVVTATSKGIHNPVASKAAAAAKAAVRLGLSLPPTMSDWTNNNSPNVAHSPATRSGLQQDNKSSSISKETRAQGVGVSSKNKNPQVVKKSLIAVRNKVDPENISIKSKGGGVRTSNRTTDNTNVSTRFGLNLATSSLADALARNRLERDPTKGSNKWGISNKSNGNTSSSVARGGRLGLSHPPSLIADALAVAARRDNSLEEGSNSSKWKIKKQDSVSTFQTPYLNAALKLKQDISNHGKIHSTTSKTTELEKPSLKAKDHIHVTTTRATENPNKTSKIPTRLLAPTAGEVATTTSPDWTNNIFSVTTTSKQPLPPKYFGDSVYRSELAESKSTSISKETRIAQILENVAANHHQNRTITPKTFGSCIEPADARRITRIRTQLREDVYSSSDDDVVSSMRQKLDKLITQRARQVSDASSNPAETVEKDEDKYDNRLNRLRPRRLLKKDSLALSVNSSEIKLPSFSLTPRPNPNNVHAMSVGDIKNKGSMQYGGAAAIYFENRQNKMREQALFGELPKRTNKPN